MLALCFVLIMISSCINTETPKQPNVIYIMADDMGYFDIGCYGSDIQTPNIDRISAEGMSFSRVYSANPVCSPTRASIMPPNRNVIRTANATMLVIASPSSGNRHNATSVPAAALYPHAVTDGSAAL